MMQPVYALQICSTGETIVTEATDKTAVSWQKRWERKILRKSRIRAERFKEAITANDTIVAWVNFDAIHAEVSLEELNAINAHIWRGYDRWFEKRLDEAA